MALSWRRDHVPVIRTRRSYRLLTAICSAFILGCYVGTSEHARLLASSVRRTFVQQSRRDGDESGDGVRPAALSPAEMLGRVVLERARLERRVKEEYGTYYRLLFGDDSDSVLGGAFVAGDASRARLRRRVQIKVLEAQIGAPSSYSSLSSHSSSYSYVWPFLSIATSVTADEGAAAKNEEILDPNSPTFVWATGGDSSAAGHGNLLEQSYTSVLEDTVRDAFASVGVTFVARNHAMGGYVSAPELALCMEAVYGSDVDALVWDFGLTEGKADVHRAALWGERAGIHPTRPILFLMGAADSERWVAYRRLEGKGLGAVLMDTAAASGRARKWIPDSSQIPDPGPLPPALRHYVCNGAIEGGIPCIDPVRNFVCDLEDEAACKREKFKTKGVCGPGGVRFQTSWHPGWKEHKLRGRLLGHFMLNILSEAILELDEMINSMNGTSIVGNVGHMQDILDQLYSQEGADAAAFQRSPPSVDVWQTNKETLYDVNPFSVFRKASVCHTALLPSQARFRGLVTNGGGVGDYRRGGAGEYDKGWNKALMPYPEDGQLPLVYDANDRQRCDALEIDHKDFFYVREGDGWLGAAIPTAGELLAYGRGEPRLGMIMVCLKICPLGRCPDESVGFGYIKRNLGKLFIEIDGRPVKQIKKLEGCHFMEGDIGVQWGPGNANGQYEMRFRVEDPGTSHWMKISSIIVF